MLILAPWHPVNFISLLFIDFDNVLLFWSKITCTSLYWFPEIFNWILFSIHKFAKISRPQSVTVVYTLSRNSKNIAKITDFLLNHLFHAQKIIMDMQVSSKMNSILQLKFLSWCPTIIKKHVQICCFVILTLKSFRKDYLRMLKAGIWKICSKTGWCKDAICKIKENLFITDLQLFKDCWCLW